MRTSSTVTEQEIRAYVKFCKDHNIANDDSGTPETLANAELVAKYFLETWQEDMTEENFEKAFSQLQPYLKFYSSRQQAEYTHIANENQHAAQQLLAWLRTQGRPGQLVNEGPEAYENLSLLLTELRGREINSQRIHEAIGRISYRPGRQLHVIPTPRIVDGRQHKDDGEPFLGRNVNMSPADYKRQAEAAYATPQPASAKAKGPIDAWETLCNQLLNYGTHGAQAAMRQIYDRGVSQRKSFREIYAEMNELKKSRERLLPTARY